MLAICLLAVVIRATVMALLPSILHPDEVMWLEQANRLVNHQGLKTWDFQTGERSWLWPGLIAGFMALGQLFGSPPSGGLAGVAVLLCIVSLPPVVCGFLWGRNIAGLPGRGHNRAPERDLVRVGLFLRPPSLGKCRRRSAHYGSLSGSIRVVAHRPNDTYSWARQC